MILRVFLAVLMKDIGTNTYKYSAARIVLQSLLDGARWMITPRDNLYELGLLDHCNYGELDRLQPPW